MTLQKYIAGRVTRIFLTAFVAVLLLITLVDFMELLRRSGDREGIFFTIVSMAFLHAPSVSMKALPFVMLLSAMWAYMMLARSSELVAASASGLSFWGMVRPGIFAAAAIGLTGICVYAPLSAAALNLYERLDAKHFQGRGTLFSVSSEGLWLREGDGVNQIVIHAARTNAEGTELRDATFYQFGEGDALKERIDTPVAVLSGDKWMLTGATVRTVLVDIEAPPEEKKVPFLNIPTRLSALEIQNSFAQPDSISFWRMPSVIEGMEAAGFSARRHKAHFHAMLALPALLGAMTLIAASFAIRPPRFASFGRIALGCALTGFAFYFMSDVSMALGASGAAPAALGAWGPVFGAGFLGLALSIHFRDV